MEYKNTKHWLERIKEIQELREEVEPYALFEQEVYNLEKRIINDIETLEAKKKMFREEDMAYSYVSTDLKIRILKSIVDVVWEDEDTLFVAKWLYNNGNIQPASKIDEIIEYMNIRDKKIKCNSVAVKSDYLKVLNFVTIGVVSLSLLLINQLLLILTITSYFFGRFLISSKIKEDYDIALPTIKTGLSLERKMVLLSSFAFTAGLIRGITDTHTSKEEV